jgi:hypothetical protein
VEDRPVGNKYARNNTLWLRSKSCTIPFIASLRADASGTFRGGQSAGFPEIKEYGSNKTASWISTATALRNIRVNRMLLFYGQVLYSRPQLQLQFEEEQVDSKGGRGLMSVGHRTTVYFNALNELSL